MSRKYLGIDEGRTVRWLRRCKNCFSCFDMSARSDEFNDDTSWYTLKDHIATEHQDGEFCLDCHIWIDDVDFAEHLWNVHAKSWKGLNSPLYKEFKQDEP